MNNLQKKFLPSSQKIFISAQAQSTRKFSKHEFRGENEKISKNFGNTKYPHAYMVYENTIKNNKRTPNYSRACVSLKTDKHEIFWVFFLSFRKPYRHVGIFCSYFFVFAPKFVFRKFPRRLSLRGNEYFLRASKIYFF